MIYLDNAATAKPNLSALSRAREFSEENFFNPSALYRGGVRAAEEIGRARGGLLSFAKAEEEYGLVFTSGGTEADNHAVFFGGRRGNAVCTQGEHAAVYQSFLQLKNRKVEPRFAPLKPDGSVEEEALLSLVDENTSLVSVVHVNNETGAVNDIASLARAVKQKNPRCIFHSDGVQAFGKLAFRLGGEIDLYSVSAHKLGGAKGTGALFYKKNLPLSPYLFGGGQELNLRSGTENVYGILSFGYAAQDAFLNLTQNAARAENLCELFFSLLDKSLYVRISPAAGKKSPYLLSVSARGLRGEILQRLLEEKGVIVGTGSACSSKKPFSRVIEACGYPKDVLYGVLRVSLGFDTTREDVMFAADACNACARELKEKVG